MFARGSNGHFGILENWLRRRIGGSACNQSFDYVSFCFVFAFVLFLL